MVSHVMVITIQRSAHLKRGNATACLQYDIVDLFDKFIKEDVEGAGLCFAMASVFSYSHFGIPLWRFSPPTALEKLGSPSDFEKVSGCAEW